MKLLITLLFIAFSFGCSQKGNSQNILPASAEISLITCRPGDQIYNTFGHTAIKVFNPQSNTIEYFNYGLFDFREPGFIHKFLRGKLLYQLGIQSQQGFLSDYAYAKRSVFEQQLNLDSTEKQQIYQALKINYLPENRSYLYDFFFDNCSTRPRDLIIDNTSTLSFHEAETDQISFRHLLDRYTFSKPWTDFGIDLIIGSIADRNATVFHQMFLPELLYHHFAKAKKGNQNLVTKEQTILNFEDQLSKRNKIPIFTPQLFFILLLALELYLFLYFRKKPTGRILKSYDVLWFSILGIGSLILLFMWFGTDHIATKRNLNCLWMHPLFLSLAFAKKPMIILISALLMLLTLLISPMIQEIHVASLIIIGITLLKLMRLYLAKT